MISTSSEGTLLPPFERKSSLVPCAHCGAPAPAKQDGEPVFCCSGCEAVYHYILDSGLGEFYRLKTMGGESQKSPRPGERIATEFLADPLFSERYVQVLPNGLRRARFSLEGIHCFACVWILERLPEICRGVVSSSVSLPTSSVTVELNPNEIGLPQVAEKIMSLGYTPHPVPLDSSEEAVRAAERTVLLRLGVAAVASMNTMLFAVSIYQGWFTGIDPAIQRFFSITSLLLSLPAVFFSAAPFFRAAWSGLRRKALTIDLPLSVAMLFGFLLSVVHTATGNPEVYYDTVTTLIFLLLASRYLQQRGMNASSSRLSLIGSLAPLSATLLRDGKREQVYVERVKAGDRLVVEAGEKFPADGIIRSGMSSVDEAVLTGESRWIPVAPGAAVYAGSLNCDAVLEIEATGPVRESRIGKLIAHLENPPAARTELAQLSDRLTAWFVVGILAAGIAGAAYWLITAGTAKALSVVLALLVVSCPCAFGIAVPLAVCVSIRSAARCGIFLKDQSILERVTRVQDVVFDKTGVVTEENVSVTRVLIREGSRLALTDARALLETVGSAAFASLRALEEGNRHPLARALVAFVDSVFPDCPRVDLREVDRQSGRGLSGVFESDRWSAGSAAYFQEKHIDIPGFGALPPESTIVFFAKNDRIEAAFSLQGAIRPGMRDLIVELEARGKRVHILSGDAAAPTIACGLSLGLPQENLHAGKTPLEKAAFLEQLEDRAPAMMVGDGANDSAALKVASVGVAVGCAPDIALETADASIVPFSPDRLLALLDGAARMDRTIRINFAVSTAYNIIGASLALVGRMNPLVAAILMPLSSASVILTTLRFSTVRPRANAEAQSFKRGGA